MTTLNFNWTSELFFTFFTNIIYFVFFYSFECLLNILFSSELWITDSSPSFFLCPLKISLLLPTSFVIWPVMKIDTAVTKRTVTRVMPIFTKSKIIIESTCISYSTVNSGWSLTLSKFFLSIDYLLFC